MRSICPGAGPCWGDCGAPRYNPVPEEAVLGARANFVIIEKDQARATYSQWAALGATYLLDDGPRRARKSVESMEATFELMDWAFAEAGYLLDFDRRHCIAFGYPEPPDPATMPARIYQSLKELDGILRGGPKAYFQHIAPKWRGWTLVWDERGTDAFAEYLKERGISTLTTQPPSHPASAKKGRVVVQVDSSTRPRKNSPKPPTRRPRKG